MRGDLEWGTIPGLLDSAAERFGPREAVVDGDTRISFEHLRVAARHAARAAIAMGVEAGDRVAIWAPNIHEWIVAALGALTAGGVLVPINTRFKGREAGFVLQKSRARLLFTVRGFLDIDYPKLLKDAEVDTRGIDVVLLRGEAERDETDWRTFAKHGEEIEESILDKRTGEPDDLSDIIFTSGTTGQPKGVMTTHAQSLRVFEVWSDIVGLREGDRYLIVNPFFHTFGYKAGILACLMRGATIVPHAVFDSGQVMQRIGEESISVLPGPPTLYQSILNDPARAQHDLSSLRLAVTGAAVVPVELIKRMGDELTFETILTAYGLTESTGTATMCRPDDDAETIANTSGCAIPDTEVKVVDDDGKEVARGEPGEIVVKGYNVTQGYFEEPEQTAETIRDGWLHTGDIGVMDARGYVKITDRKKDMFIVGGFNAYPAEIENELLRHDDIAQVAVVGAPEARLGEVGVAFVVPKPNRSLDPDLIGSWARSQLANYKVPRKVVVIDALPMNASGKVLKYELRKRARKLMEEG